MPRSGFFQDLLGSVFERSKVLRSINDNRPIDELCAALLSNRGEVSARKIGTALLARYERLDADQKAAFFTYLNDNLDVDVTTIQVAAQAYGEDQSPGQSSNSVAGSGTQTSGIAAAAQPSLGRDRPHCQHAPGPAGNAA